jgi:NTP pyrophosphatase (non-canonical NTP hydrolase)
MSLKTLVNLNTLRDEAYENARVHGFHEVKRTVGDAMMLITTEVGEAFEAFREGWKPSEMKYEGSETFESFGPVSLDPAHDPLGLEGAVLPSERRLHKPIGVPSELADIIIRVLDFSGEHGIDIERAVLEKMAFNKSRPFRHGNKAL